VTDPQDDLKSRIAEEEHRLASLDEQRWRVRERLDALRRELAAGDSFAAPTTGTSSRTSAEKLTLFRSLFRGRDDVFPTRFVSRKTGKPGYAPACGNKFVRGVCDLPRIKCGDCPNQAFLPVDDQAILDHLQGRHVMGVYPLLREETCWFLAADFDGTGWKDDVIAFNETCRSVGLPVALERSRSGDGAHAWFFFAAPVVASNARKMGCYLITETMSRRHQLGMDSYDRLFPNQDTMPRKGFGNLIALPLQHDARKLGHTVFLTADLRPLADQWGYLAAVPRIEPGMVDALASEASRRGQVIGVRLAESSLVEEGAPWTLSPSRTPRAIRIPEPLPKEVHAVLAQRLYVSKDNIPSALLNQLKRLAAFQNPEFYKKQTMRLSTALTPRVISCAEEFPEHIGLPRGCGDDVAELLENHGVALVVDDQRFDGERIELRFQGELTPIQKEAARALLQHDIGVFVAPPGIGKTVLGTYVVSQRSRPTLVLVHRRPLLDQWVTQLSMFLGIGEKDVGQIGGGRRTANGRLDVAMIQSLVRKGNVDDIVASYGHVIVDECHHVPAVSFERVLSEVKARHVLGLTATPHRRDGCHPILEMQLGPVRFSVDPRSQAAQRPFEHKLIVRETGFRLRTGSPDVGIQEIYRALGEDEQRNKLIVDDVIRAVADGASPILLTERRDHLEYFAERLRGFVRHLVVLQGGMTSRQRQDTGIQLADVPDGEERLVLATGRYIGEGFDDPRLDTLFLAMPISWKGTLVQYTGRLQRLHPSKKVVRIFDYVDVDVPVLKRMFEKRLRTYRAVGYARYEAPLGYSEPADEPTVEYDEEALRHFEAND
jgi:superfamily II DNA or RNA helicase